MKTFFIFVILFISGTQSLFSQVHLVLGGEAKIGYTKSDNKSENLSYGLMPSAGILIIPSFEFGLGIGYSVDDLTNQTISSGQNYYQYDVKTIKYDVAPYLLHHFYHWKKLSLNWGFGLNYGIGKITYNPDSDFSNTGTLNELTVGLISGITYDVSGKVQLTTNFGLISYTKSKISFENTDPLFEENFNFLLSLSEISIGIRFIL